LHVFISAGVVQYQTALLQGTHWLTGLIVIFFHNLSVTCFSPRCQRSVSWQFHCIDGELGKYTLVKVTVQDN